MRRRKKHLVLVDFLSIRSFEPFCVWIMKYTAVCVCDCVFFNHEIYSTVRDCSTLTSLSSTMKYAVALGGPEFLTGFALIQQYS